MPDIEYSQPPSCVYCPEQGPDACVRLTYPSPESPGEPVFAHTDCATARGIVPLYRPTDPLVGFGRRGQEAAR
ncbi:hypothetical protein [Streptomyces sp. PR69]|uniref:hypothetical protein n=1 Tax=Streptomyces sp. PR69 TaxID=2984950 RepID=UPI002264D83C|nr:hypothetical protein [Streptomyces sp. PR69]